MTPFLQQVAALYAAKEKEQLLDYCFVFPNKRSARFFNHFMQTELGSNAIMPEITNISDFITSFSHLTEASRYDQLFTLFDEYRQLPGIDVDFDKFVFWGDMLINDFNDVDRYLIDADTLFVNIKRLREISSNYLSDEQLDVIRRFWGEDRTPATVNKFWNHIDKNPNSPQHTKFVKLWEILQPLYHSYTTRLKEHGLASSGMLYRNAVDVVSRMSVQEFPYTRYIFIGFNVLTTAEIKIFSTLQKRGVADFYWDYNLQSFNPDDNRAGRFISRNIREFPSRYRLNEGTTIQSPNINIIGVPSNIAQAKVAGEQIGKWVLDKNISTPNNAINTAVVLPDESLFIPMIHSVPEDIGTLNVTMGFPMRLSPMSALIKNIISLHMRSRMRHNERIYFYDDVTSLLTAAILRNVNPEKCQVLETTIQQKRLYSIPVSLILETIPELSAVFNPIDDHNDRRLVYKYMCSLCDFLCDIAGKSDKMQQKFIESYRHALDELNNAASIFNVEMQGGSFFKLIERAVNSDSVNFVGEPLRGLQIMGVLETRVLDFENIIILSMNERVFPRKHYTRSFIPDALRHGFGMATIDFQESIFAYYFYRLISRAKNVTLIYDARSVGGAKSSEISRYLAQLLYLFNNNKIEHKLLVYPSQRFESQPITITKDERILKKLEIFTQEKDGKNLSASTINEYINCPLNFYLKYVEGYNADNEITDYMDSSTYGKIVHDVAQNVYEQMRRDNKNQPITVTRAMIDPLLSKTDITLDKLIVESINRNYNKLPEDRLYEELIGESLVISKVIKASIQITLKNDMELTPFTFVGAEKLMLGRLKVSDNITVNVKQIIDRIDIVGNTMRFVDYKTGSDKLESQSIEALFETNNKNRAKAILQLMLYCHIYKCLENDDRPIQPIIYKISDMTQNGIEGLKINKQVIEDYHQFYDEFVACLNKLILEIFDPEIPFTQCPKTQSQACTFCQFKTMCGRNE